MNNAVGIDVSKNESVVTILRPFGEVVHSPFKLQHTTTELTKFVKTLKNLDGETKVVLEATGKYHLPIFSFLSENGISVTSINPKLIKNFNNNSLRIVKSDKADSIKNAQYCLAKIMHIISNQIIHIQNFILDKEKSTDNRVFCNPCLFIYAYPI